MTIDRQYLLLE